MVSVSSINFYWPKQSACPFMIQWRWRNRILSCEIPIVHVSIISRQWKQSRHCPSELSISKIQRRMQVIWWTEWNSSNKCANYVFFLRYFHKLNQNVKSIWGRNLKISSFEGNCSNANITILSKVCFILFCFPKWGFWIFFSLFFSKVLTNILH